MKLFSPHIYCVTKRGDRRLGTPRALVYIDPSQPARPEATQSDLQGPRQAIIDYCNLKLFPSPESSPCYIRNFLEEMLDRTDKCVIFNGRGIRFFTEKRPFSSEISMRDENGKWAHWMFFYEEAQGFLSLPERPAGQATPRFNPYDIFGCNEVEIITKTSKEEHVQAYMESLPFENGALVSIDQEERGVVHCRWIASCYRTTENIRGDSLTSYCSSEILPSNWAYGGPVLFEKNSGCIPGAPVKLVTSQWCVG